MELVGYVGNGRVITLTLLSDGVDDNWSAIVLRLPKRCLHVLKIVAIDWTDVLDVQVWENSGCGVSDQNSLSSSMNAVEDDFAEGSHLVEHALGKRVALLVPGFGANGVQSFGKTTDGWGVGATIVVYHDHKVAVVVVGDVV